MIINKIKGKRIYLREIQLSDVNDDYLSWMNNSETAQFLESRFQKWSIVKLKNYIRKIKKNCDYFFFAIILIKNNQHIGNIKIGPINRIHGFADIGIVIGNKSYWGKGYGPEAIKLLSEFAFSKLKLNKLTAGIYANNIGSYKAFIKARFKKVGILEKHRYYKKDQLVNEILMEKLNDKYE